MRTTLALLLALSTLAACSVPEDQFAEKSAKAMCKKADQCDDLEGSVDDCIDDMTEAMQSLMDVASAFGGEYDAAAAGECIRDIKAASCDDDGEAADCDIYGDGS